MLKARALENEPQRERQRHQPTKNEAFAAKAASFGWNGNEMVKVDRDIMVLANPEIANLPNWVIALVAAGGIAAALSTAAGLLLAIASSISHDLMKGIFMPTINDKQELMYSRIAMGGAICVAGYLGLNPPGFAAQVVALAFGLAASSLFPAIMLGIFDKRCNRLGAICGMLTGLGSTLIYIFIYLGWFFDQFSPGSGQLGCQLIPCERAGHRKGFPATRTLIHISCNGCSRNVE